MRTIFLLCPLLAGCADEPMAGLIPTEGVYRFAVLPDTQCYSLYYPEIFQAQGDFVAREADALDIRAVLHLGDITEHNEEAQWRVAAESLAPIMDRLPLVFAPGNHDLGPGGSASERTSMMASHFPLDTRERAPGFLAAFDDQGWNIAFLVDGNEVDYVLVALEFSPRPEIRAWASEILAAHPDRLGIVTTHAYLFADGTRYDHESATDQEFCPYDYGLTQGEGGGGDGEELWESVVAPAANSRLVLSGHYPRGFALSHDTAGAGHSVAQLMADYQTGTVCPETGGDGRGYMLLLEIREQPDEVNIDVLSYSPWEDAFREEHRRSFTIDR